MAFIKSFRDGVLTVVDGTTPTPLTQQVVAVEGNLSVTESQEPLEIMDRGSLHALKSGDAKPMDVTFSVRWHGFRVADASAPTLYECLTRTGQAVTDAWTSTLDATSDVYTVNLKWEVKDKDGSVEETITLQHFFYTTLQTQEGDPNTLSVTGRCWSTAPVIS